MKEKKLILKRAYLDNCTIGKIYLNGESICYSVELPWKSNEPFESCIPPGEYDLYKYISPSQNTWADGFCLALENNFLNISVSGNTLRTHCLIHSANFPHELKGCIAPGLSLHHDKWGVAQSRDACKIIYDHFKSGIIKLLIE